MTASTTQGEAPGVLLPNRCRIAHGDGANVRRPFADIPLVMHELAVGDAAAPGYRGQYGFVPFTDSLRLPRHVHLGAAEDRDGDGIIALVAERILAVNGVALVELNGLVWLVPPGALVTIAPGVPHTWTACPPGVRLPDGTTSDGQFLMIYEYAAPTGFSPTARTETLARAEDYVPYAGDLDAIRFPELTAGEVTARAALVWNRGAHLNLAAIG